MIIFILSEGFANPSLRMKPYLLKLAIYFVCSFLYTKTPFSGFFALLTGFLLGYILVLRNLDLKRRINTGLLRHT
jgi:hypothetical protein